MKQLKHWLGSRSLRIQLGVITGLVVYVMTFHSPLCYETVWLTTREHASTIISRLEKTDTDAAENK